MMLDKQTKKIIVISAVTSAITGLVFGFASGVWSQTAITPWLQRELGRHFLNYTPSFDDNGDKTPQTITQDDAARLAVIQKALPSVVSIVVTKELTVYQQNPFFLDPFFENFFFGNPFRSPQPQPQPPPRQKRQIGGGSGFIVSSDGLIVTNRHVVNDERADYTVVLNNGKIYTAKILDRDTVLDVAVIKIEATGLPALPLGDSDKIKVGQTVIAIGNALGEFQNSVTQGIVSGLGRDIIAGDRSGSSEKLESVIQTDAAISPGNSGGPLIAATGEVIGVNTAVSQEGENIGFAIPINEAKRLIESVKQFGKIIRPFLGVRYALIDEDLAKSQNLPVNYGALVVRGANPTELAVTPGSPAEKAGISENDIILEINGQKIDASHSLARLLARYKVGDKVAFKVLQKGQTKNITITLTERPR